MKYLLDTTEKYRVSSEDEATALIEEAKNEKAILFHYMHTGIAVANIMRCTRIAKGS